MAVIHSYRTQGVQWPGREPDMFFSIRQRPPPKAKNLELGGGRGKGEGPVLVIVGIRASVCGVPQSCNYFLRNKARRRE